MSLGVLIRCAGCGAEVADEAGATHPYMRSAPGCWRLFGEVLAREFSDPRARGSHRLAVDAYAVQHPGSRDRRNRQSVALHLMSLALVLEDSATHEQARRMLARRARARTEFPWLTPPVDPSWVTVADVHDTRDPAGYPEMVRSWAVSAWEGWSEHHLLVRAWLEGEAA